MEPPSDQLLSWLEKYRLCSPRQLRRCRGRVRRLAKDLPAFDSVWIDALVHARRVTPFQANLLESHQPDALQVGPCLLVDSLGEGHSSTTSLAKHLETGKLCVLKQITLHDLYRETRLGELQGLVRHTKDFTHPHLVTPHAVLPTELGLLTVSRHTPGPHLAELLVRRGRFRAEIVLEIARQLVSGLAAYEQYNGIHGEISLENVRLTPSGRAVLVDAGLRPILSPSLSIHERLPAHRYDGIAPELIGRRQPFHTPSDLYALGCLLWQLLAGRPPFPTGDPLTKLAAHQTRHIENIREWAPDTPNRLADVITSLTAADSENRPRSFQEVAQQLGSPGITSRQRLRGFLAELKVSVARRSVMGSRSRVKQTIAAVMLLACVGGIAWGVHEKDRLAMHWNSITARTSEFFSPEEARPFTESPEETQAALDAAREPQPVTETNDEPATTPKREVWELPPPNAQGVIELVEPGLYSAVEVATVGPLHIKGATDGKAVILIEDESLQLWAESVTLENIELRLAETSDSETKPPSALVLAQTQRCLVKNCVFQRQIPQSQRENLSNWKPVIALAWKPLDSQDRSGNGIVLENSVFTGMGSAVYLASTPMRLQSTNCLKVGAGAMFSLAGYPQPGHTLQAKLDRLTLRESGTLFRFRSQDTPTRWGQVRIQATDCVFDLHGDDTALFEFLTPSVPDRLLESLEVTGVGSLAKAPLMVVGLRQTFQSRLSPLDDSRMVLEGLLPRPYEFAGPLSFDPADSTIISCEAPLRSSKYPGLDASALR